MSTLKRHSSPEGDIAHIFFSQLLAFVPLAARWKDASLTNLPRNSPSAERTGSTLSAPRTRSISNDRVDFFLLGRRWRAFDSVRYRSDRLVGMRDEI